MIRSYYTHQRKSNGLASPACQRMAILYNDRFALIMCQIPKMHFKLLSCISQARAAGVTQSEAARITKQDPRSFPARTKQLVEHGLMCLYKFTACANLRTKTRILLNGNMTYRLTHSRYTPSLSDSLSIATFSLPVTAKSFPSVEPSNADTATNDSVHTSNRTPSDSPLGFSRDHAIGNQIRQVIGDGQWNRPVPFPYVCY